VRTVKRLLKSLLGGFAPELPIAMYKAYRQVGATVGVVRGEW